MYKFFKNDNQPIEYASVVLYGTDRKIITGTITDDRGEFTLQKIAEGKYILEASFIGYQTRSSEITVGNAPVIFKEPIVLCESISLESAGITAEKAEKHISASKTTVNVSKNIASASGNTRQTVS